MIAVTATLIGLAGAMIVYLGLVHAVPLVDFNTDVEEQLRRDGARQVLIGCLPIGLSGALLLVGRAWWSGGIVVSCAGLLTLLAYANTIASWGILGVLLLAGGIGCLRLLARPERSCQRAAPSTTLRIRGSTAP